MSEIDEFLRELVCAVRDRTIIDCDGLLAQDAKADDALEWKSFIGERLSEDRLKLIVAEKVDRTIYNLLLSIDDERLILAYQASSGKSIDLRAGTSGELAISYLGRDGKLVQHTEQRLSRYGQY